MTDRELAVLEAAVKLVRLQDRRCRGRKYVVPFMALIDLAVAVEEAGLISLLWALPAP